MLSIYGSEQSKQNSYDNLKEKKQAVLDSTEVVLLRHST